MASLPKHACMGTLIEESLAAGSHHSVRRGVLTKLKERSHSIPQSVAVIRDGRASGGFEVGAAGQAELLPFVLCPSNIDPRETTTRAGG